MIYPLKLYIYQVIYVNFKRYFNLWFLYPLQFVVSNCYTFQWTYINLFYYYYWFFFTTILLICFSTPPLSTRIHIFLQDHTSTGIACITRSLVTLHLDLPPIKIQLFPLAVYSPLGLTPPTSCYSYTGHWQIAILNPVFWLIVVTSRTWIQFY